MLRILVIIAVALAVVIGLMQLAKHNNAVQAPDAVSEAAPAVEEQPAAGAGGGVVDAAGAAIQAPAEPAADANVEPAPAAGVADAPPESAPQAVRDSAKVEEATAPRARSKRAVPVAPVKSPDPYELQRALPAPAADAAQAAVKPADAAPAPAETPSAATPIDAAPQPAAGPASTTPQSSDETPGPS